jgi:hypothetical protein
VITGIQKNCSNEEDLAKKFSTYQEQLRKYVYVYIIDNILNAGKITGQCDRSLFKKILQNEGKV